MSSLLSLGFFNKLNKHADFTKFALHFLNIPARSPIYGARKQSQCLDNGSVKMQRVSGSLHFSSLVLSL